jgi:signal transduction histidine kinase/CheY-like chemotaxis protein
MKEVSTDKVGDVSDSSMGKVETPSDGVAAQSNATAELQALREKLASRDKELDVLREELRRAKGQSGQALNLESGQSPASAAQQAESASRTQSDFIAEMSRELKAPLNPILRFSELLIEQVGHPEHLELLHLIRQSGDQLSTAIGDVLEFTKIESGRSPLREDVFDLEALVQKQVADVSGQPAGRAVDLKCKLELGQDFSAGQRFIGDREKISRVLIKILGNAIKCTETGAVHLDCSIYAIEGKRAMLHIVVADTGVETSKASVEALLDSFQPEAPSGARRHNESGLGVAISEKLIYLMGGSIAESGGLGRGTAFSFILPLGVPVAPRTEVVVAPEIPAQPGALCDECDLPVLLVEDEELHVAYIQHILELKGCAVTVAKSGEEALALYAPFQYSIILLDIHLPGMSGIDVLKSIRGNEAKEGKGHVPILVLTADVLPATHEVCSANGVDGILNKPVCSKDLRGMMAELLGVTAESGG